MADTASIALPRAPSFRLDGKRALITDAGRGMGFGRAAALAEAGAVVSLCARSESELLGGVAAIRAAGGKAKAVVLDVCDIEHVRETLGALTPFDILINNSGRIRPRYFVDVTIADYDDVLQTEGRVFCRANGG